MLFCLEVKNMIRVKITKNIMNTSNSALGLTVQQIVWAVIAVAIGAGMYFLLKDVIQMDLLMWLIFLEIIAILVIGVIRIQGMNLIQYIFSFSTKKYYFNRKGLK